MTHTLEDIMTTSLVTMHKDSAVVEAAVQMRRSGIGDVLITDDDGSLCGIVTDRDIVVRCVADGQTATQSTLDQIASKELATLSADIPVEEAIQTMRDRAIRRIPVMNGRTPVGIVSLGDLAQARDPASVLGTVSAAPPNA